MHKGIQLYQFPMGFHPFYTDSQSPHQQLGKLFKVTQLGSETGDRGPSPYSQTWALSTNSLITLEN